MLRSMKDLESYSVGATDGIIGRVADFYFDDDQWVIRYLVVALGEGPPHRKVLISPISIGQPNWSGKILNVSLTQVQVKNSPDIDTDKPVSRQQEMGYLGYYGYGSYWGGGGLWGAGLYPDILQAGLQQSRADIHNRKNRPLDPHLRSGNAVLRYYVHASDGDIGHVQGILLDEKTWAIRYIIVNTSNWWLGHQVILAPTWIDDVSWTESTVSFGLTRQLIMNAPHYDPAVPFDRERESGIHTHYGRHGYWLDEAQHETADARAVG